MGFVRGIILAGLALSLSACAISKPLSSVGNAALRAGGITPPSDKADAAAEAKKNEDDPHWSEDWTWEGEGNENDG